jgi:mono/diheme cytochrome c family protein
MKRVVDALRRFFLPPADSKTIIRVLPLVAVVFIMLIAFVTANFAWEETNSIGFCGLVCHTMPPQYVTHQQSVHTNVTCEDCHMGRDRLAVLIPRKVTYSWQTGTAMLLGNYHFPIVAKNMAPAREACENCHKPDVFSSDKLIEIKNFAEDESNSLTSTFMVIKTGGGTRRQGLGYGIHWHVENPVYFYATDMMSQDIPYILVENPDGTETEYFDVEANFDPNTIRKDQLIRMDCITCHNRTAHMVTSPQETVDELMERGLVSPQIPEIKKRAVEVMGAGYTSEQEALAGISKLADYYRQQRADFYTANTALIDDAVLALQEAYQRTNFPEQKMDWETHPNNLAHKESPGCLRCHDGKHLTKDNESVRLECNLCHSIPVVSSPNQLTASLQLNKGFEPPSHFNPNWITLHRDIYDATCAGCHTVDDPGGSSNTSFCSNSACHGANWVFAGFNAPALRVLLSDQIQAMIPTPTPTPDPYDSDVYVAPSLGQVTPAPDQPAGPLTYEAILPVLNNRCGSCHGPAAMKGLNVLTYASLMKGGDSGPAVLPGDPANSLLLTVQMGAQPHFGQFSPSERTTVEQWIQEGALEK